MYKYFLAIVLLTALFSSCSRRKLDCDNAQVCYKNVGTDTINYCFGGCNIYSEKLLPGCTACEQIGSVHSTATVTDGKTSMFTSDHGNFIIDVDACYKEKILR